MKKIEMILNLFNNTNTTTQPELSSEMKTHYSNTLIDNAKANLVHDQFGQKQPIPKNGGKTILFRKYNPLGKAVTPLTEGVTPNGQQLSVQKIEATVEQYGGYVELSDMFITTSVDNNVNQAATLLGAQAGETMDTIIREKLSGGTNVQYADGSVSARTALSCTNANHKLTVLAVQKAVRFLKKQKARPFEDGCFVAIIHPDVTFDLTRDPEWIDAVKYAGSEKLLTGEIGKIRGCRFVETTEAKVFTGAGAGGCNVYSTLVVAKNAYGVTDIDNGGVETIIKPLGSGGTHDPLNQRATVGWKATRTAEILMESFMVRIETACSV